MSGVVWGEGGRGGAGEWGRVWQFARSTNIEGVNNAGRAGGGARTTVWLLLTVLLLALTANDIRQLVNIY